MSAPMVAGVIAGRDDRLGARLMNLLCAWRWARYTRSPLFLQWKDWDPVDQTSYDFHNFFDRAGIDLIEDLVVVETSRRKVDAVVTANRPGWDEALAARETWRPESTITPDDFVALPAGSYIHYSATQLRAVPGEAYGVGRDIPALFAELPIHPDVEAAVTAALPDPQNPPLALHIRRGDLIANLFGRASMKPADLLAKDITAFVSRYAHLGAYRRSADALFPEAPISIFSDDPSCRVALAEHFGERLVDPNATLDGFPDLTLAQRAFAELLVIARSRAVISAKSQFALVPARLGGIPRADARKSTDVAETLAELRAFVAASPRCPPAKRSAFLALILEEMARSYRRLGFTELADQFAAEVASAPLVS